MKYKLTIHPNIDNASEIYTTFRYETLQELKAGKDTAADLLLFLQDKAKLMNDYSNMFVCEELVNGDWVELN